MNKLSPDQKAARLLPLPIRTDTQEHGICFYIHSLQKIAGWPRPVRHYAKMHTGRWPDLHLELLGHFLRGYFDGDGSWTDRKGANSA